eukprot:4209426-Pyramimonas_sp.AAC.1
MNFQQLPGYSHVMILEQELEDGKTCIGKVMAMRAGQIRTEPADYHSPGRIHDPISNKFHRFGLCGDVVRRLHQIGRTRLCEDRLCRLPLLLRRIGPDRCHCQIFGSPAGAIS